MADYQLKGYTGPALEAQLAKIDTQGAKLDTIEEGANKYVLPIATRSNLGGIIAYATATTMPVYYGRVYVNSNTGMPYVPLATSSVAGSLSPADFTKLSKIWPDASNIINKVETIKVDGTALTPDSNKSVNIDLSDKLSLSSQGWQDTYSTAMWCMKYIRVDDADHPFLRGRTVDDTDTYNIGWMIDGWTYRENVQIPLISEDNKGLMVQYCWENLLPYMNGEAEARISALETKVNELLNLLNKQTLITK